MTRHKIRKNEATRASRKEEEDKEGENEEEANPVDKEKEEEEEKQFGVKTANILQRRFLAAALPDMPFCPFWQAWLRLRDSPIGERAQTRDDNA